MLRLSGKYQYAQSRAPHQSNSLLSGFTPQYKGLEALNKKYAERGLVILGFPSNQFGGQEPGTDEEIASFCELNHGVTFPLMKKSDVNGNDTNEVYQW